MFTSTPLVACWRYEPREHLRPLAKTRSLIPPSPFAGQGRLLRSRSISGLFSRSLHSGLQPPCLRFAAAVTGRHARLGTRLLARLCRRRHLRRLSSTRLQGANRVTGGGRPSPVPTERGVRISRTNALRQLVHSTASACSSRYGRRSLGVSNGVRSLIWLKASQVSRRPAQLRLHNIRRQ